jgi:hypothetical protein
MGASELEWTYDEGETTEYEAIANFCGTFDGNGQTIYNLTVDLSQLQSTSRDDGDWNEVYHVAGLFGKLENATVKNLTIENIIINAGPEYNGSEGLYVGILAGTAANTNFENIKIKGKVIVTADGSKCIKKNENTINDSYLGGLVGAANAGCTFKDITIDVETGSYVSGSDCQFVGGVVGRYYNDNQSTSYFENVKSNLDVIAANPSKIKTAVGGLIGEITQYSKTLTNCSCSGTVTLNNYAGSLVENEVNAYNMAIGGLVGSGSGLTTASSTKIQAVFTDCSFSDEGDIISNYVTTGNEGDPTNYTSTVKAKNTNWKYMGWIDGDPWQSNEDYLTPTPSE